MKLYKNLLLSLAVTASAGVFVSCEEDETLDGANQVYIEISPSEINLALGDTVRISALVTNESGKTINTPVSWKLTSDGVAQILGDTALVCVPFDNLTDQIKQTKLRAELSNGLYRLATVSVNRAKPTGIMPVDTAGVLMEQKQSYMITHDTIVFQVAPRQLLYDYEPTYSIEGECLAPYEIEPMRVKKEAGTVTIHYSASRKAGEGLISVTVGPEGNSVTGSCKIVGLPPIEGASFYGPEYKGQPYVEGRPPCHTLAQYYKNTYDKFLDFNKYDTVHVAINIQTGALTDIMEAIDTYQWRVAEGNSVRIVSMWEDVYEGHGFDAVMVIKSGSKEGTTIIECETSYGILTATYTVYDYNTRFPVDRVYADSTQVNIVAGQTAILTTYVDPISSYGFQKPVVTVADPEIASVGEYEGNQIPITGRKMGDTEILLQSFGLTTRIPLHVAEGVSSVTFAQNNPIYAFVGQEVEWLINVNTPSGSINQYPSIWTSSDESIVTVATVPDDVNKAIVKGVAAGSASITAQVLDKTASPRNITIVPLAGSEITLVNDPEVDPYENNGIEWDGDDMVLQIAPAAATGYTDIRIVLNNLYNGDTEVGTHTVTSGEATFDGAAAEIVGGTVTIALTDEDGSATITMNLTLRVNGVGEIHLKSVDYQALIWDMPEE